MSDEGYKRVQGEPEESKLMTYGNQNDLLIQVDQLQIQPTMSNTDGTLI